MSEVEEEMLHPRLREIADRDDPVSVIEAANRAYLSSYRRNAKLMGLMEQVAQIDERFRRLRLDARARSPRATRRRCGGCSSAAWPTRSSTRCSRRRRSA